MIICMIIFRPLFVLVSATTGVFFDLFMVIMIMLRFFGKHIYKAEHFAFANGSRVVLVKIIENVKEYFVWNVADIVFDIPLNLSELKFTTFIDIILIPDLIYHF